MEMTRTYFVAGANPDTFLTGVRSEKNHRIAKVTDGTVIRAKDYLIVVDMNKNAKKLIKRYGLSPSQCSLIRQEPAVVCPANFSNFALQRFSRIIDVGREGIGSTLSVPWPQTLPQPPHKFLNFESRIEIKPVLMNANKLSLVAGELYNLRRKLIHAEPVALYGPNWDSSLGARLRTLVGETLIFFSSKKRLSRSFFDKWFFRHPNYEGLAGDKLTVYSKFKVAVVIENSPDYMSEKLLDAIFAGCIPVYVGPPVADYGIPRELVVETEPNIAAISRAILHARQMHRKKWLESALEYLANSNTVSYWSPERIYNVVWEHIIS